MRCLFLIRGISIRPALRGISTRPAPLAAIRMRPAPLAMNGTRYAPLAMNNKMLSNKPNGTTVTFVDRDGDVYEVQADIETSLLEVAHKHDIDLEGACDGTLACCTCHLIVHPAWFDKLGSQPSEDEEDMLDMAYGLTETSRLGCQVKVTEQLDGLIVKIPPFEPQYT